jgi:plastocyanin
MDQIESRMTISLRPVLVRAAFVVLAFAILAFGVVPLFAAEPTAQLGTVSGTVAVTHANGSAVQPAGAGTSLGAGDRIATVGTSSATVELPGIGQIELGADTTIILHELRTASGGTVITVEIVQGMLVSRVAPSSGTGLDVRIIDPSGMAVARATGSAVFGVGRDENGNVTVACSSCRDGLVSFPGDGSGLGSGRARTLTARGDIFESRIRGGIYDALADGANAGEDGTSKPAGNLLPAGQRTGSRDDRTSDDDDDDTPSGPSGPTARIISPSNGENISGSTVVVRWQTSGYTIVPAAQATRPDEVHVHIFLDVDPAPYLGTGVPIPLNNPNIVHTANPVVTFQNVPAGSHRAYLVIATGDHVSLKPAVTDMVSFTVSGSAATITPTPTASPTATPGATIDVDATISSYVYLPDPIQIRVGDTVRWTNLDNVPDGHTVTASDLSWTSPVLNQGGQYTRTFTQAGMFTYFCEPHPFMTAFINVQP